MLTTDKAADAVNFVFDSLSNPERVFERADMGGLHAALAPSLKTWIKECGGTRNIMMVSATGSVNYDLVTETSDLDMKATYLPTFEDYYHGRFPKFNFVTETFDCELHPAHKYVQFVLKGHMNHFEPLYADACFARPDFAYLMKVVLKPMVEMNTMAVVRASWFSALKANDDVNKTWNAKKASHALRFLTFVITLLDTGKFVLKPTGSLRDAILRLKTGEMAADEYRQLFSVLTDTAGGMAFAHYGSASDYQFSDRVIDLDQTGTPEWIELRKELDTNLMDQIKKPIVEFAQTCVGYPRR